MAAARSKTHIMRWAPQDYRTSRVRMRSAMTGNRDLRLVYLEALNALHEHGGRISSDPRVLSDDLLLPEGVIAEALLVLLELGCDCDGGLVDNGDGTISNRRVVNDLAEELEFRQQQTELGRRGGRAKAKAKAKRSLTEGQAKAKRSVSPPPPPPPPLPTTDQSSSARASEPVEPQRPRVVVVNGLTGEPQEWDGGAWFPTRESRRQAESEALKLAREAGDRYGTDPPDEMARAADYPGAQRRKVNPATMSHDRLVNTLAALRKRLGHTAADSEPEPFDAFKRAGLA